MNKTKYGPSELSRRVFVGSVVALAATARLPALAATKTLSVRGLNNIGYAVPDPAKSVAWYQELFGLPVVARHDNGTTVLRVGDGPESIMIGGNGGGKARIGHVGFGIDQFDPDRAVAILKKNGFSKAVKPDPMKFVHRMRGDTPEVIFGDPDGLVIQLQDSSYCGGGGTLGNQCPDVLKAAPGDGLLKITDLNHVTCFVSNGESSVRLYKNLFGFQIDTYQGPTPILRVGSGNQQFIMVSGYNWPDGPLIDHACFVVENFNVERLAKVLDGFGVKFQGQKFRVKGRNQSYWTRRLPDRGGDPNGTAEFYFTDPHNIVIQLQDARYCGGAGYLADVCGTPEKPTGYAAPHH